MGQATRDVNSLAYIRSSEAEATLKARVPLSAVKHLGRSLMPVDVDQRSPWRSFEPSYLTCPPPAMRRAVSTGCLMSAGWGYDKYSMCDRGRVHYLPKLTTRVS